MSTALVPHRDLPSADTHVPDAWMSLVEISPEADWGPQMGDAAQRERHAAVTRGLVDTRVATFKGQRDGKPHRRKKDERVNHSPAHLNHKQRHEARNIACHAMFTMYKHSAACGYSEGSDRWEGIDKHLVAAKDWFPEESDCSSSATWALDNALGFHFHCPDVVNGETWKAGYTGTMIAHGLVIPHPSLWMRGDCLIFGDSVSTTVHTAMNVGWDKRYKSHMVLNHGHAGVQYFPWSEMGMPLAGVRRYI